MNLYLTADHIGIQSGGGQVTHHELQGLQSVGPCDIYSGDYNTQGKNPFEQDQWFEERILQNAPMRNYWGELKLAHAYAGCLSGSVEKLLDFGAIVTYTAAAHDVQKSKQAHEEMGFQFNYPHLTNRNMWREYIRGYLLADVLICPSKHSADVMRSYGRTGRIEIIPHGCELPKETKPFPKQFTVGYLGAYGPDKGIRYLLEAWKKLNYNNAVLLLAGSGSTSDYVKTLVNQFGGGMVSCIGWVRDLSEFYNSCSLYVQPSVTEGFGIEVLEACAHARPVLCSTGAGAEYLLPEGWKFDACNSEQLAGKIDRVRDLTTKVDSEWFSVFRRLAESHTWERIQARYADLWRSLLGEGVK